MSSLWPYLAALIPSVGVGFLFWLVVKNMIEGDRKERLAHSQWERERDASTGPEQSTDKASSDPSSD
jgi:hypothetical protein